MTPKEKKILKNRIKLRNNGYDRQSKVYMESLKTDPTTLQYTWQHETYNNARIDQFIKSIDTYINLKTRDADNQKTRFGFDHVDPVMLPTYGVKEIDWNMHSLALDPKNRLNIFEQSSGSRPHGYHPIQKMLIAYTVYRAGNIYNPIILRTIYAHDKIQIVCVAGFTRLLVKFAIGDLVPFSEELEYPAYLYDFAGLGTKGIKDILGKRFLFDRCDMAPEFIRDKRKVGDRHRLNFPVNKLDWYNESVDGVDSLEDFSKALLEHEYELHFYRHGVLEFKFNLGKKPLRINIDHDGIPSWIGVVQVSLWFFFGIDTWHGEKYFSIGD